MGVLLGLEPVKDLNICWKNSCNLLALFLELFSFFLTLIMYK